MYQVIVRSTLLSAVVIGLVATGLAWVLWLPAPATFTTLEWTLYDDIWAGPNAATAHPSIVLIARDEASDARFGSGQWESGLLARIITALSRADAAIIGIDLELDELEFRRPGEAAGDARLIEAARASGHVVASMQAHVRGRIDPSEDVSQEIHSLHPTWPPRAWTPREQLPLLHADQPVAALVHQVSGLGHNLLERDHDGVLRRVPVYATTGQRAVPSFGMALATAWYRVPPDHIDISSCHVTLRGARTADGTSRDVTVPLDGNSNLLIDGPSPTGRSPVHTMSFLEIWTAIDKGQLDKLREQVSGKIVLLFPLPDSSSDPVHARALNTILKEDWGRLAPAFVTPLLALFFAWLSAWLVLTWGDMRGVAGIIAVLVGYLAIIVASLVTQGLALPVVLPLSSAILAASSTVLWRHVAAGDRIQSLEKEILQIQRNLAGTREALVARESIVEHLEEDLDAARAATARAAGKEQELGQTAETLRAQLADAQAQEEVTRQTLQKLEQQLAGLRAATSRPATLTDAEQEQLCRECEDLGILTQDSRLLDAFRTLKKSSRLSLPVLILGEPGTGKELFARAVHQLSPRAGRPFVAVNMAAIPADLFESELFGHVKGSFTGALMDRRGYFEQAHTGTIFLDEIGDLRPEHQGKLLRVLQERTFYRVGDTKPSTVDVRIVAATNKDLERGVAEGWFREDLYFRLHGLVLHLPPLRQRPKDISLLAERLLVDAARRAGRADVALSEEALSALHAHPWPGNVRELQHCLERAIALADGRLITEADLRLRPAKKAPPRGSQVDASGDPAVLACLRQHGFDMQATAKALGWDRSTVTQRLKGLCFRALADAGGDVAAAARALAEDQALARIVELKLCEYHEHLMATIQPFSTTAEAIAACKKRFKNLPDRHFASLQTLIRQHFAQRPRIAR